MVEGEGWAYQAHEGIGLVFLLRVRFLLSRWGRHTHARVVGHGCGVREAVERDRGFVDVVCFCG